jgi:hypothetical protein
MEKGDPVLMNYDQKVESLHLILLGRFRPRVLLLLPGIRHRLNS